MLLCLIDSASRNPLNLLLFYTVAEMFYLISCRALNSTTLDLTSWLDNGYALLAIFALTLMQLALTYLPFMHTLFGTAAIDLHDWLVIISSCLLIYLLMELEKLITPRLFFKNDK